MERNPRLVHEGSFQGRRYRLALAALLGLVLVLAGGASRGDAVQQLWVRLAAIAAIAATIWPLDIAPFRRHRLLLIVAGALYLLPLLQLVPLPPSLWAALPGHRPYAEIAQASGTVGWRPLSLTPGLTVNALLALLPPTAALLVALPLDRDARRSIGWGILALACTSGLLGLLQLAAGGEALRFYSPSSPDSPVGLFANRNHQAVLLAAALPFAGALAGREAVRRPGPVPAAALAAVASFLLVALIATGSRMGLLLGILGTGACLFCYSAGGASILPRKASARAACAAGATVILPALALAAWRGGIIARIAALGTLGETRAAMLRPLIETARAFFPFGSGLGSFDSVYRRFEPDALLSTIFMNQAHDEPLQLLIEGGAPALLLLLLFLSWWVRACLGVHAGRGAERSFALASAAATAILMLSSLVDYPLRTPLLASLFVFGCTELKRFRNKVARPLEARGASPQIAAPVAAE